MFVTFRITYGQNSCEIKNLMGLLFLGLLIKYK